MIKAIETEYKGYRFRSRLEARWAVFFDTLGIAWEYEREGYDLGEAGWYLPDFWLPECHTWLEIKPNATNVIPNSLRVFCAGKVESVKSDWRLSLLWHRNFFFDTQEQYLNNPNGTTLEMVEGCRYVGPFSYDGCGGHGSGNPRIVGNHGSSQYPERVVSDCQQRIQSCDVVFAWIDSEDCFGTLVELGYAAALNKEIWVASPPPKDESHCGIDDDEYWYEHGPRPGGNLWYAFATANKVRFADRPLDAFLSLYKERLSPEQRKCLALAKNSKKPVLMLQGNPWPNEYKILHFATNGETNFLRDAVWTDAMRAKKPNALSLAYTAARHARFEHGEHGTR